MNWYQIESGNFRDFSWNFRLSVVSPRMCFLLSVRVERFAPSTTRFCIGTRKGGPSLWDLSSSSSETNNPLYALNTQQLSIDILQVSWCPNGSWVLFKPSVCERHLHWTWECSSQLTVLTWCWTITPVSVRDTIPATVAMVSVTPSKTPASGGAISRWLT